MAIAGRRRFLDQWARALGVTNDLDAMAKLRGLMNELDDARSQLQKTTQVLAGVPDPDANNGATGAMTALEKRGETCWSLNAGSPSTNED